MIRLLAVLVLLGGCAAGGFFGFELALGDSAQGRPAACATANWGIGAAVPDRSGRNVGFYYAGCAPVSGR